MSKPSIARCYDKLVEDLSLLGLFSGEEYMSLLELPVMGTLWFRLISEKFFARVLSPTIWRKTKVEYVTETSLRLSGQAAPMAILITDGVGKGDLGMGMTFCSHTLVKIEASEALAALQLWDAPKPRVFVVRRYTNTRLIPQGTSRLLYLDVSDLPQGTSSAQFPLDCLHLHMLLPYSKTEALFQCRLS